MLDIHVMFSSSFEVVHRKKEKEKNLDRSVNHVVYEELNS